MEESVGRVEVLGNEAADEVVEAEEESQPVDSMCRSWIIAKDHEMQMHGHSLLELTCYCKRVAAVRLVSRRSISAGKVSTFALSIQIVASFSVLS